MKKSLIAFTMVLALSAQQASAYQQNDGTGPNGQSGGRPNFCDIEFAMPFGLVFRPCRFFG